ncbi:hypothetical protein BGX21_000462 [Mortierella sp. AD011]|nr:hypothetical protein BGX21_000462 [Mortierella sp. AD011]
MHIIPCKKTSAFSSKPADASEYRSSPVKCDIKHANVVFKGEYWFDIVLSYGDSLPVLPVEPLENAPKNRDTMLTLLKDINSVDTCFVFESDKSYSNVGLWAHRVILAKYKKFDEIIQDASKKAAAALSEKADAGCDTTESSTPTAGRDENPTVLTIPVPKDFSLSTLSVLLRYIYTGEIKLIADLGQHAVSMTKSSLVIYDAMGKTRESIRWSPFDADSPWKLKDVTWEELLLAADHFGVSDMRKNCEDEVIGAMNQSNVVDTLFNIGCSFDTVKKAALDFIVENMETMMLDGQDPFVAFKNHPDCHSLMFELMSYTLNPTLATTIGVELTFGGELTKNYGTQTPTTSDGNNWSVNLTRETDILKVSVTWTSNTYATQQYNNNTSRGYGYNSACNQYGSSNHCPYKFIHLVPRKRLGSQDEVATTAHGFINRAAVIVTIPLYKILYQGKYCFDIVLSIEKTLPKCIAEAPEVVLQGDAVTKNHEIMLILLRDIHSVDVCLVAESDKTCSNVGLWAHRAILSRYKGFENAIQTACKGLSSTSEDMAKLTIGDGDSSSSTTVQGDDILGPLLIPVEKFTLATLCVLLRYVYTGQINLSAETNKHAISMTESTLTLEGITSRRKESVRWHPLGTDSSWKFKDVTWEELLVASDYYGVMDLKTQCENKVITAMNQSSVVETLFTIGCSFDKIKESALDYIVSNMATLFAEDKDSFAQFKDHPRCYEMLVEVIRRKAKYN